MSAALRSLYDPAPAWRTEWVAVPGGHRLHVQQSGAPEGLPALVLHGGPGSGCSPLLARFFDPKRYRVICIDQRGAGQSLPPGGVTHNTTGELLADLRLLRAHLGVPRWLVVGGSWGATLALAHALDAPGAVSALLLRGLFLSRVQDIAAFFDGALHGRPRAWSAYRGEADAHGLSLIELLHRRLMVNDSADDTAAVVALHWWRWEQLLAGHADAPGADDEPDTAALAAQVRRLRVQSHYLRHRCWLEGPGTPPLLERCAALPRVPTLLLHGRRDRICAPSGAAEFAQRVPHAHLRWIDDAGHDPTHPCMIDAMVHALDAYADHGDFA